MWTRENRGNYERKGSGYPSGLVDEKWSLVEPHLPPARRGFLINLAVSPASTQDRDMVAPLLAIARRRFQGLQRALAGGGYQGAGHR